MAPNRPKHASSSGYVPRIILVIVVIAVGAGTPLYSLLERSTSPPPVAEPLQYKPVTKANFMIHNKLSTVVQRRENETARRPLWRHLVDCTAAMSNLCDLSQYEFGGTGFWEDKCLATTPSTSVQADDSAVLKFRKRLRSVLQGKPVSSPLTGYATPSVLIKGLSRANQVGCDGTTTYQQSMEKIVNKWSQRQSELPLGFTMTDSKYMDLVEDQYWVAKNVVGLDHFFVAAYDSESVAHSCGLGVDVVVPTDEDTRISAGSTLRARTAISKFKVANSLALMGVTFLFWEMDVFIFRHPYPVLKALTDSNVDIIVSSHQVR
jgi:hypothetical protein